MSWNILPTTSSAECLCAYWSILEKSTSSKSRDAAILRCTGFSLYTAVPYIVPLRLKQAVTKKRNFADFFAELC